mgnify:CR=1 FL=1|tara:strand:- start:881 stop:1078 length:198 start_codon:yes stop_codon:yes gene_type:complete
MKQVASRHCANWNNGKCIGALPTRIGHTLTYHVDKKLAGKDCIVDKGCTYFEQIVIPGLGEHERT